MYSTLPKLERDFTQIPKYLYLVVSNNNEFVLIFYLVTLQGKNKSCYASLKTLGEYLNLKNKSCIEKTIQSLKNKGYIDYKRGNAEQNLANEYWVYMDKILSDINKKLSPKELSRLADREYDRLQKVAMSAKTLGKDENKDTLIRVCDAQGLEVYNRKNGEKLN